MRILDERREALVERERDLLERFIGFLKDFGAPSEDAELIRRAHADLEELFLLVIVGEFNAGKSALINALLGSRVVEEGVTPTTAQINVLQFGDATDRQIREPALHFITAAVPLLRDIHIVDTPGTNAIMREHERITGEFVPRSDLVLFVTSADRPFTETERAFLEQIRAWGKKVVVAINKIDILDGDAQVDEVKNFVAASAHRLLGFDPDIFPVSAKLALRAKLGEPTVWSVSRFEALERYITSTLDAPGRVQLKLLNPLGVAASLAEKHTAAVRDRLALLQEDFTTLEDVERQLTIYQQDLARDLELRMADIDRILLEMERRGHDFFDETMRIGRVMDLLSRSRVQQGFEQQVVADAPQKIEQKIGELVDWLVDMDLRQWQRVNEHLAERRRQHRARIIGEDAARFLYDRARLIDSVGGEAQRVVDSYDRRREAQALADGARNAVAAAAAVSAGALGFGALVVTIATTAAADATGLIMASLMGTLGFFIIPAKRRKAKEELRQKIAALRGRLSSSLRDQFGTEIVKSGDRIREGVAPYSRFVRAEGEKLRAVQTEFDEATAALAALRSRIENTTALPSAASSTGKPSGR
jgi:small GTP-binding protein